MLKVDGFDAACLGIGERCGQEPLLVYDVEKMADILIERDGLLYEEAMEYLEFNVMGAWLGEDTPIFLRRCEEDVSVDEMVDMYES